jgi:acetoin utilization deacetylase AcuC-like enzyme
LRLIYSENLLAVTLPPGHRFPMGKYRLIYDGLATHHAGLFQQSGRASIEDLLLVHDAGYVAAMEGGTVAPQALRRLGFPWSPAIAERARRSVGGTLAALGWALAHGAAGHIAGGTHHGFADRGEGYCVFNDLAVAIAVARRDHGIERVAVIDLDVHQGNGTAALFQGDAGVFTLSLHGARNYPFLKEQSSLDVPLPDGCEDAAYLAALAPALEAVAAHRPELILYQAGVDPLAGDKLGRLALSHEGLARRDAAVYALARRLGVPLLVTLGGGYHPVIERSVAAHVAVYDGLVRALGDR